MHSHLFVTLRALHVLASALWLGAAFMNAVFVLPAVMANGPAGGQVMRDIAQVRRLPVFINTVMGTSVLTGLALYWVDSGGLHWAWITSRTGLTFTVGAVLALVTAFIAQRIAVPRVKRLGQLGAAVAASGGPPSPEQAKEMATLQRELLRGSRIGATLMTVTVLLMAVARYL